MRLYALDVECAANGRGHNDRIPCSVALVNESEAVLMEESIKVNYCEDPLTEITGQTREQIQQGLEFSEATAKLKSLLGPDVILVGQRIDKDINWMLLEKGKDYDTSVDIAESFRCYNPKFNRYDYFSLNQEAYGLLGWNLRGEGASHNPTVDSQVAMRLYTQYVMTGKAAEAGKKLQKMRFKKQFPLYRPPYQIGNVCTNAFNKARCFCGQPTS